MAFIYSKNKIMIIFVQVFKCKTIYIYNFHLYLWKMEDEMKGKFFIGHIGIIHGNNCKK